MALIEEKVRHIGKAPNVSQINSSTHYVTYSEVSGVNNPDNSLTFANRYGTATPDIYLNGVRLNSSVYDVLKPCMVSDFVAKISSPNSPLSKTNANFFDLTRQLKEAHAFSAEAEFTEMLLVYLDAAWSASWLR